MRTRAEIEEADNGYTVKIWKDDKEEKNDDFGYPEAELLVAKDLEEVTAHLKECFTSKGDD